MTINTVVMPTNSYATRRDSPLSGPRGAQQQLGVDLQDESCPIEVRRFGAPSSVDVIRSQHGIKAGVEQCAGAGVARVRNHERDPLDTFDQIDPLSARS